MRSRKNTIFPFFRNEKMCVFYIKVISSSPIDFTFFFFCFANLCDWPAEQQSEAKCFLPAHLLSFIYFYFSLTSARANITIFLRFQVSILIDSNSLKVVLIVNLFSDSSKGCQDISPRRHFTPGHFTPIHFTPKTFHPQDISTLGHFRPLFEKRIQWIKRNKKKEQLLRNWCVNNRTNSIKGLDLKAALHFLNAY